MSLPVPPQVLDQEGVSPASSITLVDLESQRSETSTSTETFCSYCSSIIIGRSKTTKTYPDSSTIRDSKLSSPATSCSCSSTISCPSTIKSMAKDASTTPNTDKNEEIASSSSSAFNERIEPRHYRWGPQDTIQEGERRWPKEPNGPSTRVLNWTAALAWVIWAAIFAMVAFSYYKEAEMLREELSTRRSLIGILK